jgi:hypothetical protein
VYATDDILYEQETHPPLAQHTLNMNPQSAVRDEAVERLRELKGSRRGCPGRVLDTPGGVSNTPPGVSSTPPSVSNTRTGALNMNPKPAVRDEAVERLRDLKAVGNEAGNSVPPRRRVLYIPAG